MVALTILKMPHAGFTTTISKKENNMSNLKTEMRKRFVSYTESVFLEALLEDKDLYKEASNLRKGIEVAVSLFGEVSFDADELKEIFEEAANNICHDPATTDILLAG